MIKATAFIEREAGLPPVRRKKLYYEIDTYGGQSGSPIYIKEGDTRTAIGIDTNGAAIGSQDPKNSGTRITQLMFNWMRSTRQDWA